MKLFRTASIVRVRRKYSSCGERAHSSPAKTPPPPPPRQFLSPPFAQALLGARLYSGIPSTAQCQYDEYW